MNRNAKNYKRLGWLMGLEPIPLGGACGAWAPAS